MAGPVKTRPVTTNSMAIKYFMRCSPFRQSPPSTLAVGADRGRGFHDKRRIVVTASDG
jgi:hypothetical protein